MASNFPVVSVEVLSRKVSVGVPSAPSAVANASIFEFYFRTFLTVVKPLDLQSVLLSQLVLGVQGYLTIEIPFAFQTVLLSAYVVDLKLPPRFCGAIPVMGKDASRRIPTDA